MQELISLSLRNNKQKSPACCSGVLQPSAANAGVQSQQFTSQPGTRLLRSVGKEDAGRTPLQSIQHSRKAAVAAAPTSKLLLRKHSAQEAKSSHPGTSAARTPLCGVDLLRHCIFVPILQSVIWHATIPYSLKGRPNGGYPMVGNGFDPHPDLFT